jgi:hypothetical protein
MRRLTLAPLAIALVALLGTTGCHRHRYRVVYAYRVAPPPPPVAADYEEPPPPAYPPAYPAPQQQQPVVIHSPTPATIIVNPPRPGPTTVQVYRPTTPVPAAPAAPPAAPAPAPAQADPGWLDQPE